MKMDIHAHYLAHLTTPLDIDHSLKHLPFSIMFETIYEKEKYAVEIQWEPDDLEWNDPLPDGSLEYGTVKTMRVDIHGQGIVLSSGLEPAQLDKSTFQAYERVVVDVIRKYITWGRVKTGQSWLDDRFAIRTYNVEFYHCDESLIEEHFDRNPNPRFVSLHPADACSELSAGDWSSIAEHFKTEDTPPRLERLLIESRALLAARFSGSALILVVSALEDVEQIWLRKMRYDEIQKEEFQKRRLTERIKEIATKAGLDSKERRLISKMIAIRHDNIHNDFVEPREKNVMSLIRTTSNLARWARTT